MATERLQRVFEISHLIISRNHVLLGSLDHFLLDKTQLEHVPQGCILQIEMVIWSTGSSCSCSRHEINVQGMDLRSSTLTVSFSRSAPLWVVISVNAALTSLFYNAWLYDWILTGFLESTIPESLNYFFCNICPLNMRVL